MVVLKPTDPCPCESGKSIKDCSCLRADGELFPPPCSTDPSPPKTGFGHPQCYLSELADCGGPITNEHFLSAGVLEIHSAGDLLTVTGYPGQQPDQGKPLPVKALGSNILCKRHNTAFSPLDTLGKRFFRNIDEINAHADTVKPDRLVVFNGHDLERLMLKVLCGFAASGIMRDHSGRVTDWKPSLDWVEILFGHNPMPMGCGLYYLNRRPGEVIQTSPAIRLMPLLRDNRLAGLGLDLISFVFLMIMDPTILDAESDTNAFIFRPRALEFVDPHSQTTLLFAWEKGATEGHNVGVQFLPREKDSTSG